MASTPPGWPAQLRDAVVHPGTLNAGPPVQPRAYAAAASSTEWPAPPQAMRGHSDRQQVDGAAADSSGPPGAPQPEAPVRVIPGAGAGPGCEATRPGTARAAGTKRLWQVGGAGPAGLGSRSSGNLLAVLTGRAQQVSFSPSRTPRAGPAHVIQQLLRKVAPSGGRPLQIGARCKPRWRVLEAPTRVVQSGLNSNSQSSVLFSRCILVALFQLYTCG